MSFIHPTYLWTLLGLLVPIVIHLWSKKEAKTIKIGSIQLLSESNSKQSSSIQLNEWLLLLLRLLILMLVTLVLAKPQWQSKVKNTELTYIVEPSLAQNEDFMARLGGIVNENEIRLLEKGFPIWEVNSNDVLMDNIPNYWALASEMDALHTDSILVFTKGYSKGLKGARPQTNHHINWIVLDSAGVREKPLIAYQKQEGIQLFSAVSTSNRSSISSDNITLDNENISLNSQGDSLLVTKLKNSFKVPVVNQSQIEVSLFYTDNLSNDKIYIEAAFSALSKYLDRKIKVYSKSDSLMIETKETDLTIWLSEKSMPNSFQKLLLFKEDSMAQSLIEPGLSDEVFYLTNRITSENAVSQRLTENLLHILDVHKEVNALLEKQDFRTIAGADLQTNYKIDSKQKIQLASWNLSPYLWAVLFALLLIERFVAYKRKQ
ncbi:BatA domain-containing protein [Maribacter sp. ACAM166]|uniref:BatA domain-containing protein n=1 Tax=Maribacter sp. ACAM166 TaxID=2508996 RepID=UPI0010FE4092|nr:BatA domain-containing protein [Maribacter sp. ACAM166]TLP71886.1 hypothetical protein ES765_19040 [Maribacter sp. ACAM166]